MIDVKNDVLMKLNAIMGVLGNVEVKGEQNFDNMSGSIKMLRDICSLLGKCDIYKTDGEPAAKAKEA